jgi:hypothetical protein
MDLHPTQRRAGSTLDSRAYRSAPHPQIGAGRSASRTACPIVEVLASYDETYRRPTRSAPAVVDRVGVLYYQARRITHGITEPVIGPVRWVLKPVRFGSISFDLAFTECSRR